MRLSFSIYLLPLFFFEPSFGSTVRTPAQSASRGIAASLGYYAADHEGAMPPDLLTLFGKELERFELFEAAIGAKVNERFNFLNQQQVNDAASGRVILITRDRVSEDRRDSLGRYVVWLKNGVFQSTWESEDRMQLVFKLAGQSLEYGDVWMQPDSKYIDHPPVVPGTEPQNPVPTIEETPSSSSANNPYHSKQPNAPKPSSHSAAVPHTESKSLLVLFFLAIAATSGAVLFFLRKSK